MLIIRVNTFELTQHIRPRYLNIIDGRTGGRTDGRKNYDSNTALALRASRGKIHTSWRNVSCVTA